jgi:glyoxylase-like metal-dependent hydrolase (beta-lactamase superfamily II)
MKYKYWVIAFLCICFVCVYGNNYGQSNEQEKDWLIVKKIADKTWCITDNGIVNMYLLEGNKKALLIDVGYGVANLKDLLKTITKLPVTVVLTHGHRDHSGAAFQFSKIYANVADFESVKSNNLFEQRKKNSKSILKDHKLKDCEIVKDSLTQKLPKLKPLKDGNIIDLGGRRLKVIEVPGHTPGSVVFLDVSNKMLFSGDHINCPIWLFLNGCLPVEAYLKSLEKIKEISGDFNKIYPGHNELLDSNFLDELIICCKSILDGNCSTEKYVSSAGDSMKCQFKRAIIAFNPDNLRIKN